MRALGDRTSNGRARPCHRAASYTIALTLVLAACGGDSTEPTTSETTATTAPTTSETTGTTGATTSEATAPPEPLTIDEIEATVASRWPDSSSIQLWSQEIGAAWACIPDTADLTPGAVLTCTPDPPVTEGQHPVLTVLVLDGHGTVLVLEAGLEFPILGADTIVGEVGTGLDCTRLVADDSALDTVRDGLTPEQTYGAVVLYWFVEGRPSPLMDVDENGIPCETDFADEIVAAVWAGGWLP